MYFSSVSMLKCHNLPGIKSATSRHFDPWNDMKLTDRKSYMCSVSSKNQNIPPRCIIQMNLKDLYFQKTH